MILPSLANKGPILVAKDLCFEYKKAGHECTVFYFDNIIEVDFPCDTIQISFWKSIIDWDKFDIIHSHMYRPDAYIFLHKPYLKIIHAKFVSTLHQHLREQIPYDFPAIKAYLVIWSWLLFLKRFDCLVTLSDYHKSYYKKFRYKKVITIHNGRDVNYNFEINETDKEQITLLKKQYKIIGGVAYITKRKGYQQLIKALTGLPQYALVIIGDGPYLKHLKSLADDCGVNNRCLWLGSRKKGYLYMRYFDLYALCSYTEGYPLAFIEAAAAKLPVVASDIPVFKTIIPINCAKFFHLNDTHSLCKAITETNKETSCLSKNIYSYYINNLTSKKMYENYISLYLTYKNR